MKHLVRLAVIAVACVAVGLGCSSHGTSIVPSPKPDTTAATVMESKSQTQLWGYYDCYVDPPTKTVTVVPARGAMFTANVTNFLNKKPAGLNVKLGLVENGSGWTDIYADVSITHPFPGMPQYNGYDVRGIFMGDGSAQLTYNPDLKYPVVGTDQSFSPGSLFAPIPADGYTRWFNLTEFSTGGMPLFQYTPGKLASPGFDGTATLCPYRYFTDGLGATDDLWTWLAANSGQHGVFSSGVQNTRRYSLRFPNSKGIRFGYAIIANWGGTEPIHHPSNAPEAVACSVAVSDSLFYVDPSNNGGNLAMDISLWDWDSTVVSGVMQDYTIYLESTVLSADHKFNTSEMTPTGGGAFFSTYHVDIPADAVSSTENNEFWVIAECSNKDYTNELGVPNLAGTDPLAAFFRYHLHVGSKPPFTNTPPVINGISDDIVPDGLNTTVYDTDTSVTYSVDYTDPDVGQDHTIAWYIEDASATDPTDPPDAMPYDWSTKPLGDYKIWVKVFDGFDYGIGGPYAITKGLHGWARTWGAGGQDRGYGVATDSAGGIYVTGSYYYNVDFDPGPGQDMHNSNGNRDSFISKFNSNGDFQWARTWDDNASFGGGGNDIATDSQNNVVVAGYFYGTDVDFDPGAGQDLHTSLGTGGDAYITKFDSDGNFLWARTWGGTDWLDDAALGIAVDGSDNVYASGGFLDSVDFDPGAGDDTHASVGYRDIFLTKFDPGGNHLWAQTFGGAYDDYVFGCQVDHNNDVYITGWYYQQVDFDPGPGTDMHDSQVDGHAFLSKFDPSGAWQWARTWGSQDAYGFRVGIDSANDVYVSGGFAGTGQFDPTGGTEMRTANGSRDCFLEKFAPSGTFNWVRIWDSIASGDNTGGYIGYLAKIDPSDNVYVTGHFTQTADLDPGPGISDFTSNGDRDTFVSKLDTSGTFQWARTLGGSSTDDGAGVAIDPNGDVYTTGWFFDTVDFNPGVDVDDHTSNGSLDAFLMKMSKDGTW